MEHRTRSSVRLFETSSYCAVNLEDVTSMIPTTYEMGWEVQESLVTKDHVEEIDSAPVRHRASDMT
jgi:hypothetical protein